MRVAIVGAGPAGSALAIFLARQGAEVTLFDDGRRPELLVGESLVPAVVPILQRLGLEGDTTQCGRVKPGVTFVWSPTTRFSFTFARFAPSVFPYAYNIARPQFGPLMTPRIPSRLARTSSCGEATCSSTPAAVIAAPLQLLASVPRGRNSTERILGKDTPIRQAPSQTSN